MMDSPMQLFVDRNLPGCSGCRICEKMCSLRHEKKWNPAYSRIKVYQFYPGPIDVPIVCQYCEDKPCVAVCPFGALSYDSGAYLMKVDESLCTGCQLCGKACSDNGRGGCITFKPVQRTAQVCDLCEGDPQCVVYCPSNVLHFHPLSRFPKRLAKPPQVIADQIADQFYPVKKRIE